MNEQILIVSIRYYIEFYYCKNTISTTTSIIITYTT